MKRERAAFDTAFVGVHAVSQVMLFNAHPTGRMNAGERLDALTGPGGVQVCGNAQNCVAVCPKHIPLTTSLGLIVFKSLGGTLIHIDFEGIAQLAVLFRSEERRKYIMRSRQCPTSVIGGARDCAD